MQVMRMYHIQDRDDYKKYNKLCGLVTKSVNVIKRLDPEDPIRIELTDELLDKYDSHLSGELGHSAGVLCWDRKSKKATA